VSFPAYPCYPEDSDAWMGKCGPIRTLKGVGGGPEAAVNGNGTSM